jgi:hypothetical protein
MHVHCYKSWSANSEHRDQNSALISCQKGRSGNIKWSQNSFIQIQTFPWILLAKYFLLKNKLASYWRVENYTLRISCSVVLTPWFLFFFMQHYRKHSCETKYQSMRLLVTQVNRIFFRRSESKFLVPDWKI